MLTIRFVFVSRLSIIIAFYTLYYNCTILENTTTTKTQHNNTAVHGTVLGFAAAFFFKFGMGDPDTKDINEYYEEHPPR